MTKSAIAQALWHRLGAEHIPESKLNSEDALISLQADQHRKWWSTVISFLLIFAVCGANGIEDFRISLITAAAVALVTYMVTRRGLSTPLEKSFASEWYMIRLKIQGIYPWRKLVDRCWRNPALLQDEVFFITDGDYNECRVNVWFWRAYYIGIRAAAAGVKAAHLRFTATALIRSVK